MDTNMNVNMNIYNRMFTIKPVFDNNRLSIAYKNDNFEFETIFDYGLEISKDALNVFSDDKFITFINSLILPEIENSIRKIYNMPLGFFDNTIFDHQIFKELDVHNGNGIYHYYYENGKRIYFAKNVCDIVFPISYSHDIKIINSNLFRENIEII